MAAGEFPRPDPHSEPGRTSSSASSRASTRTGFGVGAALTRLLTDEDVLWLARVRVPFVSRVARWAADPKATTELVLCALDHALAARQVHTGEFFFHSDKGASVHRTAVHPASRRRRGRPADRPVGDSFNALAEELWSTIKVSLYWPGTESSDSIGLRG